jgi:hypothetical protein
LLQVCKQAPHQPHAADYAALLVKAFAAALEFVCFEAKSDAVATKAITSGHQAFHRFADGQLTLKSY